MPDDCRPGWVSDWRSVVTEERRLLGVDGNRLLDGEPKPGALYMGVCLSGGGIRSASFNLGVLQALDAIGLLKHADYLSTVSGGGYIGSWFAACKKEGLSIQPWLADGTENPAFRHLRRYSRYLTPQGGLLSVDTLTMLAILVRNMLLNQGIVFAFLAAALLLPAIARQALFTWPESFLRPDAVLWACCALFCGASIFAGVCLRRVGGEKSAGPWQVFLGYALPVSVLTVVVSACYWNFREWMMQTGSTIRWIVFGVFALSAVVLVFCSVSHKVPVWRQALIAALVAGICGGAASWLSVRTAFIVSGSFDVNEAVVVLPALMQLSSGVLVMMMIGLMGRELEDARREWWSRVGAMLATISIVWALLSAIAIYVPVLWSQFGGFRGLAAAVVSWAATGAAAYKFATGFTGERDKADEGEGWLATAGAAVAAIFVVGMLCGVAIVDAKAIAFVADTFCLRGGAGLWTLFGVFVAAVGVFGWRFDVNEFSLNHFYRNRLVRCYMGAARPRDKQDRLTGLDFADDFDIGEILPGTKYRGPFHIVNTSLNLPKPTDLAVQDRKADSFVITPKFCGSATTGYCKAEGYNYIPPATVKLGTAVAISGAAASPNMGHFTSPMLAFLMTVFNVRLGWWSQHPKHGCDRSAPPFGFFYLLKEMFAAATNNDEFLYLSDGGHFENLGAYELIRRGCRLVIVGDGECDGGYKFGALGNLIRICRLDFNVEIVIDPARIADRGQGRFGKVHCAVGRIKYPDGPEGILLYLKSSLTGDETPDVLQYASKAPDFPHETTADQFFSEEQFESYRKLGEHVALEALETAVADWRLAERNWQIVSQDRRYLEPLLLALNRVWFAPSKSAINFTRHTAELVRVWETIRGSRHLGFLDAQIFPAWQDLVDGAAVSPRSGSNQWLPTNEREVREAFYLCQSLIQLMENVYVDLNFEEESAHPDNRGWMNLFRHWTGSGMMRVAWALSCQTYGARFQSFARRELDLTNADGMEFDENFRPNEVEMKRYETERAARPSMQESRLVGVYVRVDSAIGGKQFRFRVGLMAVTRIRPDKADQLEIEIFHWMRIQNQLRSMGLGTLAIDAYDRLLAAQGVRLARDGTPNPLAVKDEGRARAADWFRRNLRTGL